MPLEPAGQTIDGKYSVIRCIGEGGMGSVFEGVNTRIGRRVAIKVLHAHVAQLPEFAERFEKEARAAARIGSSYVCDVFDLGDLPGGDRYIVMEYLDGMSLEARMEAKVRMTPQDIAPIAWELLDGLATMHGAGVIHRDLKPANVFLMRTNSGRGEEVRILDFGVAKIQAFPGEVASMTQTGAMMGTPLYMSPEQARGARDVDARSDIYSVSVMFYRALTGQLPFAATSLNELLFKIVLEDPPPILTVVPDLDEGFAAIIQRGMVRDPEHRIPTARAYQELISAWGRAQGRTSLQFPVHHSSDSAIPASSFAPTYTGDQKIPASIEAYAKAQNAGRVGASTGPDTPPIGTPLGWADDRPMSSGPPMTPPPPAQAPMQSSPPKKKKSSLMPLLGIAASLFAVVGIVAVVMAKRGEKPMTAESAPSAAVTAMPEEPKTPTTAPAPTQLVETTGSPLPNTSAVTSATPPDGQQPGPVVLRHVDPAKPKPSAEPVAIAPQPQPTPVTPAPSASAKGRKFRTNLD